ALGNGVRTERECTDLAAQRLDAATALLDARLLAGEASLFESMHGRIVRAVSRGSRGFLVRLREAAAERHARSGSVSHLLEPDLKDGSGGLRDAHSLRWVAWAVAGTDDPRALEVAPMTVLRSSERAAIAEAEEYLTRLRTALHLETGKKVDRVLLDLQPSLARALGIEDEPGPPA